MTMIRLSVDTPGWMIMVYSYCTTTEAGAERFIRAQEVESVRMQASVVRRKPSLASADGFAIFDYHAECNMSIL